MNKAKTLIELGRFEEAQEILHGAPEAPLPAADDPAEFLETIEDDQPREFAAEPLAPADEVETLPGAPAGGAEAAPDAPADDFEAPPDDSEPPAPAPTEIAETPEMPEAADDEPVAPIDAAEPEFAGLPPLDDDPFGAEPEDEDGPMARDMLIDHDDADTGEENSDPAASPDADDEPEKS